LRERILQKGWERSFFLQKRKGRRRFMRTVSFVVLETNPREQRRFQKGGNFRIREKKQKGKVKQVKCVYLGVKTP